MTDIPTASCAKQTSILYDGLSSLYPHIYTFHKYKMQLHIAGVPSVDDRCIMLLR